MLIVRRGHPFGLRAAIASLVALLALALALSAGFAARASAQLPAICDQYPELPQCSLDDEDDPPGGGGDPAGNDDDTGTPAGTDDAGDTASGIPGADGGPTAGAGAGARGELPFTGYPLTPLLLLLLAVLLAGLLLRASLALRDRIAARAQTGGGTPA